MQRFLRRTAWKLRDPPRGVLCLLASHGGLCYTTQTVTLQLISEAFWPGVRIPVEEIALEIEAKFILPDEHIFRRLVDVDELGGLRLSTAQVKQVRDRYVDTAQGAFLRGGYACRLRAVGDVRLVTLKSIAVADDAVHRREEVEVRLTPTQASGPVDLWPASEATDFARHFCAGQPLELLFELQQERHVRLATRRGEDQPVIEVSVDHVCFSDDSVCQVYELEAELLPAGRLADLTPLTVELIEQWALLPQAMSKFERGLALCCPELSLVLAAQRNSPRSLA